jgi:hypothetical protein
MTFYIYAHELGQVDYVGRYDTKAEAAATIRRMLPEKQMWSSWPPRFEISTEPPHQDAYQFADMSGWG